MWVYTAEVKGLINGVAFGSDPLKCFLTKRKAIEYGIKQFRKLLIEHQNHYSDINEMFEDANININKWKRRTNILLSEFHHYNFNNSKCFKFSDFDSIDIRIIPMKIIL
jgi:hypothetical protein